MTDTSDPTPPPPAPCRWWEHGDALARFVADLLVAEFAQARPGRPPAVLPRTHAAADVDLVRDLGADSLDLLALATALAEALGLAHGAVDDALLARPRLADWIGAARAGLAADGGALTFRTSGSTGTPKRCTHSLSGLVQEVDALAGVLPGRRRILSAVPCHHIYGFLFTVLLPARAGIVEVADLRGAAPAALAATARPGDLVVAHPAWWDAVLRLRPAFGPDVAGVTSTAPCPDALADGLRAAGLRLVQVYGSSETAGVGWRDAAGDAYTLLPYWSRGADAGVLERRLPDGASIVRPLPDRMAWEDARRFRPLGRVDEAVQVGGVNVFPAYVADVLRLHPAVLEASVRPMRPDEGHRLKAFVVPRNAAAGAGLAQALDAWVRERLGPAERPAAYTFGARLPRQASGKPADWIIDAV
jgi:4-coumarate--CoA ligase (photoactive yellow protein activation family)